MVRPCSNPTVPSPLEIRINSVITQIISLPTSQWVEAASLLVADVRKHRKGIANLKAKMSTAADAKVAEAERMVRILRREPCLEPSGEDKVFMAFKTRRIARLFLIKPEMLEYLHTQAQAATSNKGWRSKVKLYEEIAEDPEKIIAGAEMLCLVDEARGSLIEGSKCTIRETLDAMDWYADNKHAAISAIYEEYNDVPTKEMFLGVGDERPAKSLSRAEG